MTPVVSRLRATRLITTTLCVLAPVAVVSETAAPAISVARLKAGNARFAAGAAEPLAIDTVHRSAPSKGSAPFAAVLSCTDPGVPPEVVFGAGAGELVVVRSAGQTTDRSVLAGLEHAVDQQHVPLIVVMGHHSCDLVKAVGEATLGQAQGPNREYVAKQIRAAVGRAAAYPADVRLRGAILENVEEQINEILRGSAIIRHKTETGEVGLVGAYYEPGSGSVHFSEIVRVSPTAPSALTTTPTGHP